MVQWIDIGLVTPTAVEVVSAAVNCLFFWRYARKTASTARRLASTTLALLSGALLTEAMLFLVYGSVAVQDAPPTLVLASLAVRWLLLAASALLGLLVWRSPLRRV